MKDHGRTLLAAGVGFLLGHIAEHGQGIHQGTPARADAVSGDPFHQLFDGWESDSPMLFEGRLILAESARCLHIRGRFHDPRRDLDESLRRAEARAESVRTQLLGLGFEAIRISVSGIEAYPSDAGQECQLFSIPCVDTKD